MAHSPFFALLHRLRTTHRWSGMMSLHPEDVAQHTFGVAVIAHALCVIDEHVFGKRPPVAQVLAAALFHDASEAILTDVVAPVKKYSPAIQEAFTHLEQVAEEQLLSTLPDELRAVYQQAFDRDRPQVHDYIHAADKLDALCKCKQELRRGNLEFALAERQLAETCERWASSMPSVRYFLDHFVPAFERSIDEYRYLQ